MAAFDRAKQKQITLAGCRKEIGSAVVIAGVSGQTFTIATKMRKVFSGHGMMLKDGIPAKATTGLVSNGQVTFTRLGPISLATGTGYMAADTIDYVLYGF